MNIINIIIHLYFKNSEQIKNPKRKKLIDYEVYLGQ